MNLNECIIKIRVDLQNSKINKSGLNKFAGFTYYELKDFLPKLNELMLEHKVNDKFYIETGYAYLELIKGEEREVYSIPFVQFETPLTNKSVKSMQDIQYLGALNTYYKRYLYLNAFGITDGEIIDSMDSTQLANKKGTSTKEVSESDKTAQKNFKQAIEKLGLDFKDVCIEFKITSDFTKKDLEDIYEKIVQKKADKEFEQF